jgi:benzoylformate decarboxylase
MSDVTVRDAFFDVLRERELTTLFSNPGSTEVPLLVGLPDDLRFVLALHEASVVGLATGYALGRGDAALAVLHTTAGLGNAVGALATARVNRVPLVVLVGQQDRRHLAHEPFLTGRLATLAGEYPVWVNEPTRAYDVPAAILRASHEAVTHRGPALVIVPMDDWSAPADTERERAAPARVERSTGAAGVDTLLELLAGAERPALVAGSSADWPPLVALAERIGAQVWQESFSGLAGFPQDHRLFAGHLPADRTRLRDVLDRYDVVVCVGAAAFKQYPYADGRYSHARVAVLTDDADEAHRAAAELAVLASPASVCRELAARLPQRDGAAPEPWFAEPLVAGDPLYAGHVLDALQERLPRNAIVVEETPSSRPELHRRMRAVEPLGFVSAAMGGLGFALPAATGLRMALPERPVVAVVGDGSALYSIQALWSAAQYSVGAVFVVLNNGGYAVMDRLAERHDGGVPWPRVEHLDLQALAAGFGCPSRRVQSYDELGPALDDALAERDEPLLLEVVVEQEPEFAP